MSLLLTLLLNAAAADQLSFATDIKPVFSRRCASCHDGSNALPNVLQYEIAYPLRTQIATKVGLERFMPKFGRISESERDLVRMWVEQGAAK